MMQWLSLAKILLVVCTFTAQAAPQKAATVTFSNGETPCTGTFLESKADEAEPVLTVTECLENFHSGGLELRTSRGEIIRSQDVVVHPSLIESRQSDPKNVSDEMALAVVFFPAGTRAAMGMPTSRVADGLPTDATTLSTSSEKMIAGTPVLETNGGIVALSKQCDDQEGKVCKTVSLFSETSRNVLLAARNLDKYAMGEVSVPDTTHELGLFFRRSSCQPQCQQRCQPVQYYYCQPAQPQQCAPRYQPQYQPPPPARPAPAPAPAPQTQIRGAHLPSRVIVNANIEGSNIPNAIIVNSNIHNSNISNSRLQNTNVHNSHLPNSTVTNGNVHHSTLPNSNLRNTNTYSSNLPNSNVTNSNVYNSHAPNSSIRNSNLYNSSFPNSDVRNSSNSTGNHSPRSRTTTVQPVIYSPPPRRDVETYNRPSAQVVSVRTQEVAALPPPPPPPPSYNGMYDTAATRPYAVGANTLEGQVASSVRQLEGSTSAQANLLAANQVPLLKGKTVTSHASTLTLLAKGETPVSPSTTLPGTLLAQVSK